MVSYKDNDPRGWCGDPTRGAAMGRVNIDEAVDDTFKQPFVLKRVPIRDGYDSNGTYFGVGENLYWLASEDGSVDRVFRAKTDADAISWAANQYTLAKLPERIEGLSFELGDIELDAFTQQYLETALWSSTDCSDDSGGNPLDENYDIDDIAIEAIAEAKRECDDFQDANEELLEQAYQQSGYNDGAAGHDFWLTRNGHGAGFWDRGLGEVGKELAKASKAYGSVDMYVGDDGKIYTHS